MDPHFLGSLIRIPFLYLVHLMNNGHLMDLPGKECVPYGGPDGRLEVGDGLEGEHFLDLWDTLDNFGDI